MKHNPFAKHTPSLFVVCSPFQVLCAIAAINQLEIKKYKVFVQLLKDDKRTEQTIQVLEQYCIPHNRLYVINKLFFWILVIKSFFHKHNEYKRLFIGDVRSVAELYAGYNYISDGCDVLFLDDGNITIGILNDNISAPIEKKHQYILKFLSKWRNINYGNNFFTIYGDIPNPRYCIKKLYLRHVLDDKQSSGPQKDVIIVGTNIDSYCGPLNISEDFYIQKLGNLMKSLRELYPDDDIIFMQHGREYKKYGRQLCEQYGCVYKRPQMMIELELLHSLNPPKAIYGYTSTALFTLKKIFPRTKVVNILFESSDDNPFYQDFFITSEYYLRNGIEWIGEPLS